MTAPQPTPGPGRVPLREQVKALACPRCDVTGELHLRRHIEVGGIPMEVKAPAFPAIQCKSCGFIDLPVTKAAR